MPDKQIFISYSRKDQAFVTALRRSMALQKIDTWVDSREMPAGKELDKTIKEAIEKARAFIVVLSLDALNSAWVQKETRYALKIKKKMETPDDYPVIPLLLKEVKPAALNLFFKKEPVAIDIKIGPGGISEAMPQILAALGERSADVSQPMLSPEPDPLEELVLEITDPVMVTEEGTRRAGATAKLTYFPAGKGKREAASRGRFKFTAPLGPIENEELSWYLERYYIWPAGVFKQRAENVEKKLPTWGKMLYDAVLQNKSVRHVFAAWEGVTGKTARRFTVFVDSRLVEDEKAEENDEKTKQQAEAGEAAALLLGLPWELLHNGRGYLFQGARPVAVRRRLPNRAALAGSVSEPPIRILLVSPRPEDDSAGYIDHRVSALPLVTALESLGNLAELTVLTPPTFPALQDELQRAYDAGMPYQVVHFDGHGVFHRELGLGGLCFEEPEDTGKLEKRRSKSISAGELGEMISDHRIPLFFLEACQTAKAEEDPTTSVAAALLDQGVASVVAMSHSVLVETARRFVEAFYKELALGSRVGRAMWKGQRELYANTYRLKIFGAGRLDMQDWFVPVLYQEKEDLQLLTKVPSRQIKEIDKTALEHRFGALPPAPEHDFIGRSRELLKLERLLEQKNYAVVCGQGGEGKTTIAVELARWLVRSNRFDRAVFVSVEDVYDVRTVIDRIGQQLVTNYSVAEYDQGEVLKKALHPIERELRNHHTLIILDNMESILPHEKFLASNEPTPSASQPPLRRRGLLNSTLRDIPAHSPLGRGAPQGRGGSGLQAERVSELDRFEPEALEMFFELCKKLLNIGDTRLLFTSREELPAPYAAGINTVTLSRLHKEDAIELVQRAIVTAGFNLKEDEKGGTQPEVEALVDSVNRHARSLVLLAPYINRFGVRRTTENLSHLMAELHKKFPDERERSLFAGVELSLRRLSPEFREKISPLGLFQGGGSIVIIGFVLELEEDERDTLVGELLQTGLAGMMPYGFLRFHPALCPYLRLELGEEELGASTSRWAGSMKQLSDYLYKQQFEEAQLSATLTMLELPNLIHLLQYVQARGDAEDTVDLATSLEQLIAPLGRPHLLNRIVAIREEEAKKLGDWNHTRFESSRAQIERLLGSGNFPQALQEAQTLLDKCLQAGEDAYTGAAYDTAMAHFLLGRVLRLGGAVQAALPKTEEAWRRFRELADRGNQSAARMASASLTEKGDCLSDLGRLDEAAAAYEAGINLSEELKDKRQVAAGKFQLGTVRMHQKRYDDALAAFEEAREIFENLGEPASVATAWHQTGMVHEAAGHYEAAEKAYRQSLALKVQQNNPAGEASSLGQLGNLYNKMGRLEEAVVFYRQAADKYVEIKDMASEGRTRNNLANTLIKLKRYDEARREITRAIECDKPYGHAAEPWKTWNILCDLEKVEGNKEAADKARQEAIRLYLSYRRDGGENHSGSGRLCLQFLQAMQAKKTDEMAAVLQQLANDPGTPSYMKALIPKLQAILAGDRDPALAEDPGLDYDDAAEVLFILENLP